MRDLKKTLNLCATEDAMDYCPEFDGVKSILVYSDQNVKPFKKLCFRSGNDSIVNDLVRRFQEYFVERQLIDADTKKPLLKAFQTLRKILVFLLANTDATYKYNLKDDNLIAHVYELCPLLPKFLTVALVWELQLDQLFYEALAYTPCWFAFQFFDAASESLKYIEDPKSVLIMMEELLKSLLINLERSSSLQMDLVDQKIIFNKMYDQAIILLRRFNTPDASKLDKMKKRELHRYWGYCIKHLLQMVLFAFDLYESKSNNEPGFDISIYKIGAAFEKRQSTEKHLTQAIQDEKLKIINALLGTLQNSVMTVQMTSFIEWAEVDLTPHLTLQQSVGEMAYKVRQRMTANASFEHGVDAVLVTIEIRPRTLEQIAGEATIGDILRTLDDCNTMTYEEKKTWYDELFKRGTASLDNAECMETIMEHLKLLTKENCMQVMDCIKLKQDCAMVVDIDGENGNDDDDDGDDIDNDELKTLLQMATQQLKDEDLLELLDYRCKLFGENSKALLDDPQIFDQQVIKFLNNCTTAFNLHEFLILSLQDPLQLWTKFFASACHVLEQVQNFRDTVMKTLPSSLAFIDKVLKDAVLNETQPVYFPQLFAEIYFLIYKGQKTDFIAKFLNGHIKTLLDNENYESLLPLMNGLDIISAYDEKLNFEELTAPMLAMVSNVAERARWVPNTFDSARVQVVTVSINFVKETLNRFLPVITEKDRKWLTSKLKSTCGPLTQYYFQRLNATGESCLSFDEFLLADKKPNEATILAFLKRIILRCTAAEFSELMANKSFHQHVPIVLKQIINDINDNPNEKAALNFRYCLNSYLNFVNSALDDSSINWTLIQSIFEVIAASPKDNYEQIFMDAECLLQQLVKTCAAKSDDSKKQALKDLKDFVETTMADCTAKDVFLKSNEFA